MPPPVTNNKSPRMTLGKNVNLFIASLFEFSFKDYIVLMILVHTHHK
jgi:hypothetical protein